MLGSIVFDDQSSAAPLRADFFEDLEAVCLKLRQDLKSNEVAIEPTPDWAHKLGELDLALTEATEDIRRDANYLLDAHALQLPDSPLFNSVSLFQAMGFYRNELSHTLTLAWLVDPVQPHGFGKRLFHALISACNCHGRELSSKVKKELLELSTNVSIVDTEAYFSKGCRVDIFAQGLFADHSPWTVLLEAKVDARERKDQLGDYESAAGLGTIFGIFLSPDGRLPASSQGALEWATLSYSALARVFLRELVLLQHLPGAPLLRLYLTGVLTELCGIQCHEELRNSMRLNPYDLKTLLETQDA